MNYFIIMFGKKCRYFGGSSKVQKGQPKVRTVTVQVICEICSSSTLFTLSLSLTPFPMINSPSIFQI